MILRHQDINATYLPFECYVPKDPLLLNSRVKLVFNDQITSSAKSVNKITRKVLG